MTKILIPVDGSEASRRAVNWVIGRIQAGSPLDVELLNIQPEIVSGHARAFLSRDDIQAYMKDEAEKALAPCRALLDQHKIPYRDSFTGGHAPEAIAKYTKANGIDQIVMGTRGLGSIRGMLLGSVATGVLHLVDVPVTLVK